MKLQALRDTVSGAGGTVTLSADLDPGFADLLSTYFAGQPITITDATISPLDAGLSVTGSTSVSGERDLPVTATLTLDEAGALRTVIEYELIGEVPGPSPWYPSRSLPDLPTVWSYDTGYPLVPVGATEEDIAALPEQQPFVDSLDLFQTRLIVASGESLDPSTQAPLRRGMNLVSKLRPGGNLGIFTSVLRGGPQALTLYGTLRSPTLTERTPPLGTTETVWSRTEAPGLHLQADLDLDFALGGLVLDQTRFRVYTPHSSAWMDANPSFRPMHGYAARLSIPSADITVDLGADLEWGLPRTTLYASPEGLSLGKLAHLVDLVGGDDLSSKMPQPLQKAAKALSGLSLTYLSLDLIASASAPELTAVTVELGMPGMTWKVWKDDLVVRDIACRFTVRNPFGGAAQRSVSVTVMGIVEIEGVAVGVEGRSDDGFSLYAALLSGETIPLGKLMKRYTPGVPVPASLTVTTLRMLVAPGKSYAMALAVEGKPKPWTIDVGPSTLTISKLDFDLRYAGGQVSGSFAGSATYGKKLSLDVRYDIPGDIAIRSVLQDVKLSQLISWFCGSKGSLPKGFDLSFAYTSVQFVKRGSSYVFQAATQVETLSFAFEVRKGDAGWGFAAGFALSGPLSSLPGLGGLKSLEKTFALQQLTVTASSFDAPSFQFPSMAQFATPRLAGTGDIALPESRGLTAGLCAYAQWAIDTNDQSQKMLRKFLGLPSRLGVAIQVGKDPAKQSKLFVDLTTSVSGNPLVCQFGAMMSDGQPSLFLDGQLSMKIGKQPVVFSVTMLMVSTGMFLSGTMAGTVEIGKVALSNLAVMTAVSWSGIPSLGIAATIGVGSFSSSIAILFDSTNPAKSLFAGSVTDITLADVVGSLAKPKNLPASTKELLGQFGIEGTQPFTIPGQTATALDNLDVAAVAQAFSDAGEPISSSPSTVLLVVGKAGKSWQLTDMRNKMRHYQLVKKGQDIEVTIDAQIYCAPQATSIGKLRYDQGFYLNGTLEVLGVDSTTTIEIAANKGISIDTYLDRKVVIYKPSFFALSDVSGKKGPRLSVSTFAQPRNPVAEFRQPHFYVDGKLTVLGTTSTVFVKVTTSGGEFLISQEQSVKLRGVGASGSAQTSWSLSGKVGAKALTAGGSLSVDLDGKLDLSKIKVAGQKVNLGKIKLDFEVAATIDLGFDRNKAYAKLSGSFKFQSEKFSFSTNLDVDGKDLAKIEKVIVAEIEKVFLDALEGPQKWAKWAKKGALEGIDDAKQAAKAIKDAYGKSAKDTAKLLKGAGYAAQDVGDAIQDGFDISEKAMAKAMQDAGYAASTAQKVAKNAFKSVGKELGKDVKKAGKQIGKLFK